MTDSDVISHEERRRMREVVIAAERFIATSQERTDKPTLWDLRAALNNYREAERRALKEATR